MRLLAATVAALLLVPVAAADTKLERDVRLLQRQVKALTAQVKVLKAENVRLRKRVEYVNDYSVCSTMLGHDYIRLTWEALDPIALRVMGTVAFGPQQRLDDRGACQRIGTQRSLVMRLLTFEQPG